MVLTPRRLIPLLCLSALVAGCASQQAARIPGNVAPSPQTIVPVLDKGTLQQDIYIVNNSSQDIRITGITLSRCFNVRMACDHYSLNILVPSGQRRMILTVARNQPDAGFDYLYHYTWIPSAH